ncbi:MAG: TolC family protein [Verrucomicrobia bacterium]|mgnify:CR=1 FL=1|nr:TolC family protein [Verrucomicrobiota bacterium]MBT7067466.1 TolC family protein [Verrucomicrobiota bacterium]
MTHILNRWLLAAAIFVLFALQAFSEGPELDFNSPKVSATTRRTLLMPQVRSCLKDAEVLTDSGALADALAKSTDVKTANLKLSNMIEALHQVRYSYYPDFRIELEPAYQQIEQENRSPEEYSKADLQGALKLNQHLPGNIDVSASASRDLSFTGRQTDHLRLVVEHELLQSDPVKRDLRLAGFRVDLGSIAADEVRRNFIYEFKSAYYSYLESWLVYLNALVKFEADKTLNKESQTKYGAGIIAQYQLLDYDRDFTESQIAMSSMELQWRTARNQLLYLLQRPLDDAIQFEPVPENDMSDRVWDASRMVESAMKTSLDVASLNHALLSNQENMKYYRRKLRPSLSLFGSADHDLTGTYTEDEDDITDERTATSYAVGLKLVLPIFQSRFIDRSKLNVFSSTIEISELELNEQFRFYQRKAADDLMALKNLHERYILEKKRFHIAFADYELGKLRFENGSIGSYDMIRSKNHFFSANARCIRNQYQLLRKIAAMEQSYPLVAEKTDDE